MQTASLEQCIARPTVGPLPEIATLRRRCRRSWTSRERERGRERRRGAHRQLPGARPACRQGRSARPIVPGAASACASRTSPSRPAIRSHRTLLAFGPPRHANQRPQLHDGLIELPGALAVLGNQCSGELPDATLRDEALPGGALSGEALPGEAVPVVSEEDSQQYATDVRVYCRNGLLVGERRDCPCRVRSDSRKLDELVGMVWQCATEVLTDHARKRVEIGGAGVIAQPVPLLSHSPGLGARERLEIRKLLDEPRIILRHATHLRLLEHEFGHEHAIGIARPAPRQVARGAGPPREQLAAKPHPLSPSPQCGEGGRQASSSLAFTPHGSPRYCTWQTGRSSRLTRYDWSRARVSARSTTWDASASSWSTCSAGSSSGASGSSARSSRRSRWATGRSSSCCSWPGSPAPSRASRPATSSPARCRSTTPAPSSPSR